MAVTQNDILEAGARLETQDGDDVINVFQFRYEGVPQLSDTQGINDVIEFLEAIYAIVRVVIPILSVFRDITVRNTTTSINHGVFPWATLVNGAAASNDLPPAVSSMISFPTGISRVTLRKYFGNVSTNQIAQPGTWSVTHQAQMVSAAAIMVVPFVATNGTWAYGHNSPKIPGWIAPAVALVTSIPAYQRRRRQGRGS